MAKGRKTGGRNIQPGQRLPGAGRPPLSDAMRAVRALTQEQLAEMGSLLTAATPQELNALVENPETTVLRVMLGKLMERVMTHGDPAPFDALMNRIVGKVKDKVQAEVTGANGKPLETKITFGWEGDEK